jgi:hemoglobin/transferrin/lactoferrin receptor protein
MIGSLFLPFKQTSNPMHKYADEKHPIHAYIRLDVVWCLLHRMNKPFLIFFFLLLSCSAMAQQLLVLDGNTGVPIPMANVYHQNTKLLKLTDQTGQADLSLFRGLDKISISSFGYITSIKSFKELEEAGFVIKLSTGFVTLQQALVSAMRWEQPRAEIPAHLTAIDKDAVRFLGPQTAADMLARTGEVFIQKSQQGGGSPMIRGFSTNRLLYTVDGIRMNTAIFRSGNLHNVISLDPLAIANTEVFFGPGAIIYGSDAIGAVMSFETLQPQFSDSSDWKISGSVIARTATANTEKTVHVDVAYGNDRWAGISSFSRYDFGDLRMGRHGPDEYLKLIKVVTEEGVDRVVENPNPTIQRPTGYQQINLMQKLQFKANENLLLAYAFHFSETSSFDRYDRLIRLGPNGTPRSAEWRYGPQKWQMHHLNIRHEQTNGFYDQATLNLAYQYFEESRIDRNFNSPIRRTRLEQVDAFSLNLDLIKTLGRGHKVFYGVEGIVNEVSSTGTDFNINTNTERAGASRYPQANWSSTAAYISYRYKVSPNSLLQSGLRYSNFNMSADFSENLSFFPLPFADIQNNAGATTGSLGWVYTPATTWTFHLNGSTGFRAPNIDDLGKFFDSEPGTVMVPNPDLGVEYAYNIEFNIGKVLAEKLALDFTAYYTYLDNALVRRDFLLGGRDSIIYDGNLSKVLALQNSAWVGIKGFQASMEFQIDKFFTLSSKINIQKGTEVMEDGQKNPSRHAPPTFGVSRINFKKGNVQIQGYVEHADGFAFTQLPLEERGKPELYAKDENGLPYSPAWWTLNLKSIFNVSPWLKVNVGLENILDQRYRTYSSGIAAPGRNFTFALIADF